MSLEFVLINSLRRIKVNNIWFWFHYIAILQHSRERIYGPQNKKIYDEEGNDKKTGKLYILGILVSSLR